MENAFPNKAEKVVRDNFQSHRLAQLGDLERDLIVVGRRVGGN